MKFAINYRKADEVFQYSLAIRKWMKLPLDINFKFFYLKEYFSRFTVYLKRENTYLFLINLIMTNKPCKKTWMIKIISVKFFG
jgi:hypothetical protein